MPSSPQSNQIEVIGKKKGKLETSGIKNNKKPIDLKKQLECLSMGSAQNEMRKGDWSLANSFIANIENVSFLNQLLTYAVQRHDLPPKKRTYC